MTLLSIPRSSKNQILTNTGKELSDFLMYAFATVFSVFLTKNREIYTTDCGDF